MLESSWFLLRRKGQFAGPIMAYRQLAVMLAAGMSPVEALDLIIKESRQAQEKSALTDLKNELLNETPEKKKRNNKTATFYNATLVYMLKKEGAQEEAISFLHQIADDLEKMGDLQQRFMSSLIYPVIVLAIAVCITMVILIFVIPVFQEMFADMESQLPASTQFVINLSEVVRHHMGIVLAALALLVFLGVKFRRKVVFFFNYLPVIGPVFKNVAMVQFTRALSFMVKMDTPIPEAFQQAAMAVENPLFLRKIQEVAPKVGDAKSLKAVMEATNLFPETTLQAVAVGEKGQALGYLLDEVSKYYQKQGEFMMDSLMMLIDILVVFFMGLTVGPIVIAMYQPIFTMAGSL